MVEVAQFWFNRFRKRLARYEKRHRNNLALIHVVAATIALRKIGFIYRYVFNRLALRTWRWMVL